MGCFVSWRFTSHQRSSHRLSRLYFSPRQRLLLRPQRLSFSLAMASLKSSLWNGDSAAVIIQLYFVQSQSSTLPLAFWDTPSTIWSAVEIEQLHAVIRRISIPARFHPLLESWAVVSCRTWPKCSPDDLSWSTIPRSFGISSMEHSLQTIRMLSNPWVVTFFMLTGIFCQSWLYLLPSILTFMKPLEKNCRG